MNFSTSCSPRNSFAAATIASSFSPVLRVDDFFKIVAFSALTASYLFSCMNSSMSSPSSFFLRFTTERSFWAREIWSLMFTYSLTLCLKISIWLAIYMGGQNIITVLTQMCATHREMKIRRGTRTRCRSSRQTRRACRRPRSPELQNAPSPWQHTRFRRALLHTAEQTWQACRTWTA
ncbi:hypothetical protein ATCV1_z355R [Acanthocystis turfacea chlorella virus 1]|uniref:Uncharacterized protein z355R n=1 Tax=Chlorovirus heliozoae TaxID=322019 RepID=A7K8W5_9PHYC|nr:hypothetical protein ATCV1_z355R [Acanthocystis turfacea chlorella virus 1]ABT16489.1 hypothetical protein ATCV1_z355R [Acanthocystis turfacea chlorella virus 1]